MPCCSVITFSFLDIFIVHHTPLDGGLTVGFSGGAEAQRKRRPLQTGVGRRFSIRFTSLAQVASAPKTDVRNGIHVVAISHLLLAYVVQLDRMLHLLI